MRFLVILSVAFIGPVRVIGQSHLHLLLLMLQLLDLLLLRLLLEFLLVHKVCTFGLAFIQTMIFILPHYSISVVQIAIDDLVCVLVLLIWISYGLVLFVLIILAFDLLIELAQVLHHLVAVVVDVDVALVFLIIDQAHARWVLICVSPFFLRSHLVFVLLGHVLLLLFVLTGLIIFTNVIQELVCARLLIFNVVFELFDDVSASCFSRFSLKSGSDLLVIMHLIILGLKIYVLLLFLLLYDVVGLALLLTAGHRGFKGFYYLLLAFWLLLLLFLLL